jgi:uncharacterized alpha/beta hydrolase family protein
MNEIKDLQSDDNTNIIIKAAAKNAMEKLKKYYQFTYAIVYNVSTGMLIFFLYLCNYVNLISLFLMFYYFF